MSEATSSIQHFLGKPLPSSLFELEKTGDHLDELLTVCQGHLKTIDTQSVLLRNYQKEIHQTPHDSDLRPFEAEVVILLAQYTVDRELVKNEIIELQKLRQAYTTLHERLSNKAE